MECASCEKIIKKAVLAIKGVKDAEVDYVSGHAHITYETLDTSIEHICDAIESEGYACRPTGSTPRFREGKINITLSELKNTALMLGVITILAGGYYVLEAQTGFSTPQLDQNASLALIFIIGLFTGFHCIAMCGGFVVGYSTASRKQGIDYGAHITYGAFKTLSYAFFGAVFGFIGSFFTFTPMMRGMAAVLAGLFLVVFGLNMLDKLTWFKRFRFKTPSTIEKYTSKKKNRGPAAIGLLNGLMIACGPLQAIYVVAAASGSPYYGALYLAAFGLGTLPVLLGFGVIASALSSALKHRIFRTSGMLVIILGLIMVNRGVALTGTGYDVNTILMSRQPLEMAGAQDNKITVDEEGFQEIRMKVTRYGWEPDKFVLKRGVPVKWIIDGVEITNCNNAIQVPKLGLEFDVVKGEQVIEFTPSEEGVIPWSCWMGMIPGAFIVKDAINLDEPEMVEQELEKVEVPRGGDCGGSCGSPTCGAATGGSCGCGGRR